MKRTAAWSQRVDDKISLLGQKHPATGKKEYWTAIKTSPLASAVIVDDEKPHKRASDAIQSAREKLPIIQAEQESAVKAAEEETARARAEIAALEAKALVANAPEEDPAPVFDVPEADIQAALEG